LNQLKWIFYCRLFCLYFLLCCKQPNEPLNRIISAPWRKEILNADENVGFRLFVVSSGGSLTAVITSPAVSSQKVHRPRSGSLFHTVHTHTLRWAQEVVLCLQTKIQRRQWMTGRPMKMPLSETLMRDTFRTGVNLGRFQVPLYGLAQT
jgi:hypothetical protein